MSLVLDGIEAPRTGSFSPVKINAVVVRGVNEDGIIDIARRFRRAGLSCVHQIHGRRRNKRRWRLDDVVPAAEIVGRINRELPLEPVEAGYRGEVARRWRYKDGSGEIGVISALPNRSAA